MEQHSKTVPSQAPRRTRSRSGCWTCREAGYKCDEAKPDCGRCVRLQVHCKGYGPRLKWRPHNGCPQRRSRRKSDCPASVSNIGSEASSSPVSPGRVRDIKPYSGLSPSIRPSDMTLEQYRLLHHWTVHTSPLLCISPFSEVNPFQLHLTPMALLDDSPLRHAVISIAASHLSTANPSHKLTLTAQKHRIRAIAGVREQLNTRGGTSKDPTLASILLLEISKQFDTTPQSDVNHLLGAKEFILARGGPEQLTSPCTHFLLSQILHHDLLSAVSKGREPLAGGWLNSNNAEGLSSRGYHPGILQAVARISHFKAQKQQLVFTAGQSSDMDNFIRVTGQLEAELDSMIVPATNTPEQTHTTEAHRAAALIYLYRVVYDIGAPHPSTLSQVRRCIDAIASVPCSSPFVSAHVWPLFTAGCEATDPADRDFVKQRLADMYTIRRMRSLQKVGQLMEQVWYSEDAKNAVEGAEEMCRVGCIEVVNSLGEMLLLV